MKQEYRKQLEEINNECDLKKKILKLKELFEKTDFLKEHDMLDVFDYVDKSDNLLERFLRYRDDEDVYKGVDVDVSLGTVTVYCMMFDYLQIDKVKLQASSRKKCEIMVDNLSYRGDTLTSVWTPFRTYLTEVWFSKQASKEYEDLFEVARNRLAVPKHLEEKYTNCEEYIRVNLCKNKSFFDIVYNEVKKSKELLQFLERAFCIGNYIEMPIYLNPSRSHGGKCDTIDYLLWKIYQYYQLKQDVYLESLFDKNTEVCIENCKKWLKQTGSWDEFVEEHCLQDFVEHLESGKEKYGRPICMKTGNPIDCDLKELKYEPMPNSLDECETFFENVSERIRLRTERIDKKIK